MNLQQKPLNGCRPALADSTLHQLFFNRRLKSTICKNMVTMINFNFKHCGKNITVVFLLISFCNHFLFATKKVQWGW